MRLMIGTSIEHPASDHNNPFVLKSRNCTYHAPNATSVANSKRPIRESGVVFGSEIMKKANNTSAPLSSRCNGIAMGSPKYIERPTTNDTYARRKANVTSDRAARLTTSEPTHARKNAKNAAAPHCPGDTQTRFVRSSIATIPPLVGLKRCLPSTRIRNLQAIVTIAATTATSVRFVRRSRQSDSPEIRALRALDANGDAA